MNHSKEAIEAAEKVMGIEYVSARNCGLDQVKKLLSEGWKLTEQITHQTDWPWKEGAFETEYRFKRANPSGAETKGDGE